MRLLCVVLLIGCSGVPYDVDAGADAGPEDAGSTVTMRYTYFYFDGASFCDTPGALRECSHSTEDDGGRARWQAVYADAGCIVTSSTLDCRALCGHVDGGQPPYCCQQVPPGGALSDCRWSPP